MEGGGETRGQKKRDVALSKACLTEIADNLSPSFSLALSLTPTILSGEMVMVVCKAVFC